VIISFVEDDEEEGNNTQLSTPELPIIHESPTPNDPVNPVTTNFQKHYIHRTEILRNSPALRRKEIS
jgi:hypothetical protein